MTDPTGSPADAARALLDAIRHGDEVAVWEVFSSEARRFIVERGRRRGLPADLADEILSSGASDGAADEFLVDVLAGLEKDLERIRLDRVVVDDEPVRTPDGGMKVLILEEFVIEAGPQLPPLPVASALVVSEDGAWRVERLIPRPG